MAIYYIHGFGSCAKASEPKRKDLEQIFPDEQCICLDYDSSKSLNEIYRDFQYQLSPLDKNEFFIGTSLGGLLAYYMTITSTSAQSVALFNPLVNGYDMINLIGVVQLDPLDIHARIDDLKILPTGWFNGEGESLSSSGLDWFVASFDRFYPDELLLPYLYPTPEGALQAEWSIGPVEMSLIVNLTLHSGEWHWSNFETDEDHTETLDLNQEDAWQTLASRILDLGGRAA